MGFGRLGRFVRSQTEYGTLIKRTQEEALLL